MAGNVVDILQLVAQLDDREANHSWIERQCATNGGLNGTGGIKAHDEVPAFRISSLMFGGGFGEGECAPVCIATDYAAGTKDLDTGISGDSITIH